MAKKQIEIEIIAKGRPAERSIDKVDKKTKKLGNTTESTGAKMRASWAKIGLAIAGVTLAAKKGIEASKVQVKAEIALTSAIKLNSKQGEMNIEMWKTYASQLQNVTTFGDELTLQQLAYIKTLGLSDKMTKKVIETAMDYATATGKDLKPAVMDLTMSLSGQAVTLGRVFKDVKALTKEQLMAGQAIDIVKKAVKGQSKAFADSNVGGWTQLTNKAGDAWESLGAMVLSLVKESGALFLLNKTLDVVTWTLDKVTSAVDAIGSAFEIATYKSKLSAEEIEKNLKNIQKLEANSEKDRKQRAKDFVKDEKEKDTFLGRLLRRRAEEKQAIADVATEQQNLEEIYGLSFDKAEQGASKTNRALKFLGDNAKSVAETMGNAFADFAVGTKISFKDMTKSIIRNLIAIQVQSTIMRAITGLFSPVKATGVEPTFSGAEAMFHTGTANIKSFHSGNVRSDERLAKLQMGEAVVNRAGAAKNRGAIEAMNAGMSVGGGGNVTTAEINFNVQAIDASSFNSYLVNNRSTIEGIINSSLATNGSVRRTIKQTI